jgi:hypothetical protein
MKTKMIFLSVGFLVTLLQGCSAHVSGSGGGQDPTPPTNFKNIVDGPVLDGTWKSGCVESDRNYGEFEITTLTVSGQNVSRQYASYLDSACAKSDSIETETGLFRYATSNGDGVYEIEYQFNLTGLSNGFTGTYQAFENVRLEGEVLYVSDEIGGTAVPSVALTNTLAPAPAPTSVPTSTPTVSPSAAPVLASGGHAGKFGDTVTYTGLSDGESETESYTNQGYNDEEGEWSIFENIQGPNPSMGYADDSSVWSSAQTTAQLQNCVSSSGSLQTVTVKAGTFQTCMKDDGTSKRWYGDIPILGLVKMVSDDGTYAVEVSSYVWADSQNVNTQ